MEPYKVKKLPTGYKIDKDLMITPRGYNIWF